MLNDPHYPAGHEHAAEEHGKAVSAVADHLAWTVAERDPEHDGGEQREEKGGGEVGDLHGQLATLSFRSQCGRHPQRR